MKDLLKEFGVWFFMPVSSGMGHMGIPDFICCYKGRFIAIETKAARGVLTDLQARTLQNISGAGGCTFVVVGESPESMGVLRALLTRISRL